MSRGSYSLAARHRGLPVWRQPVGRGAEAPRPRSSRLRARAETTAIQGAGGALAPGDRKSWEILKGCQPLFSESAGEPRTKHAAKGAPTLLEEIYPINRDRVAITPINSKNATAGASREAPRGCERRCFRWENGADRVILTSAPPPAGTSLRARWSWPDYQLRPQIAILPQSPSRSTGRPYDVGNAALRPRRAPSRKAREVGGLPASPMMRRRRFDLVVEAKQILHGNFESNCNPSQCAGPGKTRLPALNLIKGRPRYLGAIRQFIGAPALRVTNITHSLS